MKIRNIDRNRQRSMMGNIERWWTFSSIFLAIAGLFPGRACNPIRPQHATSGQSSKGRSPFLRSWSICWRISKSLFHFNSLMIIRLFMVAPYATGCNCNQKKLGRFADNQLDRNGHIGYHTIGQVLNQVLSEHPASQRDVLANGGQCRVAMFGYG